MNNILKKSIRTIEKILTSEHAQAKKAHHLIPIHLVLQIILLATVLYEMQIVFYIAFVFFMLVTAQLIIYGIKLNQQS